MAIASDHLGSSISFVVTGTLARRATGAVVRASRGTGALVGEGGRAGGGAFFAGAFFGPSVELGQRAPVLPPPGLTGATAGSSRPVLRTCSASGLNAGGDRISGSYLFSKIKYKLDRDFNRKIIVVVDHNTLCSSVFP